MSRSRRATTSTWSSRIRGSQWWRRWLHRATARKGRRAGHLVGRDFTGPRLRSLGWQRLATPLVMVGLAAALILTTLRNDIVRMEYDLAEAGRQEQELLDLQRRMTVKHRQLLAPARLTAIARERGFVRPRQVIDLPEEEEGAPPVEIAASRVVRP